MKLFSVSLLLLLLSSPLLASAEIVKFQLFDGETVEGKLSLPADTSKIKELVIYIHGTGPGTYDKHRKMGSTEFNYFDLFAQEFNNRGIAFFTYNKRGVTGGDTPPLYEKVDREKYKKVLPSIEAKDIATFIGTLRKDKRLSKAKIVLMGWSEGSIIASMAADDKKNKVSALLLAGYANDNLFDVIKWQNSGGSSMVNIRGYFDANHDNQISKEEYESEAKPATAFRTQAFGGAKFEQLDVNKDNVINAADFGLLNKARYEAILAAVEKNDDEWIWNNYFHVTTAWLKEHFALEANKVRLLRANIPVYIFQGEDDANCPVEGVYDLQAGFKKAGKTNLHAFVFKLHNHDLNYIDWLTKKEMPEGIKKLFESAEELDNQ
ncbi:MAG TPA: alpha/beta fold hydrolase [Pyrinomonadaceae bacterium]|jgi:dipeptidyl aminopeptidase/acylaminoacyl peptidase|nr:alpha/beta fold hydrolase [Pyrinomonadaceae bacterium]